MDQPRRRRVVGRRVPTQPPVGRTLLSEELQTPDGRRNPVKCVAGHINEGDKVLVVDADDTTWSKQPWFVQRVNSRSRLLNVLKCDAELGKPVELPDEWASGQHPDAPIVHAQSVAAVMYRNGMWEVTPRGEQEGVTVEALRTTFDLQGRNRELRRRVSDVAREQSSASVPKRRVGRGGKAAMYAVLDLD